MAFYHVGNLQKKATSAVLRAEAVRLNFEGVSEEEIALRLGKSTRTIQRYLHTYLESDRRYGIALTAKEAGLARAQERATLQHYMRLIAKAVANQDEPETPDEKRKHLSSMIEAGLAYTKLSERLCRLDGLDADKDAQPIVSNSVNNAFFMAQSDPIIQELLDSVPIESSNTPIEAEPVVNMDLERQLEHDRQHFSSPKYDEVPVVPKEEPEGTSMRLLRGNQTPRPVTTPKYSVAKPGNIIAGTPDKPYLNFDQNEPL